jgi:Trk-type K+ transport system membrane component
LLGAIFIYWSLDARLFATRTDQVQFAVFHAVSAFCNAGFSTLSAGLYDHRLREQYDLQLVIAWLVILGGIGFPVIFNLYQTARHYLRGKTATLLHQPPSPEWPAGKPGLHVNTRLILVTTAILLGLGTVLFYVTERTGVLAGRSGYGQLVTAFFGSVTPRTAGFNTVDMEALSRPTILFYLLFMWIGASPGSTGGGIKTTTFAIAVLNSSALPGPNTGWSIPARNPERIGTAGFCRDAALVPGDRAGRVPGVPLRPRADLIHIAFECFSAYATVG